VRTLLQEKAYWSFSIFHFSFSIFSLPGDRTYVTYKTYALRPTKMEKSEMGNEKWKME